MELILAVALGNLLSPMVVALNVGIFAGAV